MNTVIKFLKKHFKPVKIKPLQADEIEVHCPTCRTFRDHKMTHGIYKCLTCESEQNPEDAVTRADTSW